MSKKVKMFDVNLPPMNSQRETCAAAVLGDRIFVMGGKHNATAEIFDISTQQWNAVQSPMSTEHWCGAVVPIGNDIIVLGGTDEEGNSLSSAEKYDSITKQWTSFPSMIEKRASFAAAVLNGKIFVVGGNDGYNWLSQAEEYDPNTGEWSEIPDMHSERIGCAAAVLDGKLYVMGGHDGRYNLSSAEVYNPTTKQWALIPDMTAVRNSCAAVPLGGRVVVVGGFDASEGSNLTSCEAYDPATQSWLDIASMHTERNSCAAVEVEGTIYAVGGLANQGNPLSSMESLPPSTFFPFLLDDKPDLVKELGICDSVMPTFLSFVGFRCKLLTLWKVVRKRQDLLTI